MDVFSFPDGDLKALAGWVVKRIESMSRKAGTIEYAAQVLRIRAEVRTIRDRARLTAASFGSDVWADEGLAEQHNLTIADISYCRKIVEPVPADVLTQELKVAIDRRPTVGCCSTAEQAQAVVLGLASRLQLPDPSGDAFRNWLCFLTWSNDWIDAFAPPVIVGLLYAGGVGIQNSARPIRDSLRAACEEASTWDMAPGRLRANSLDVASRWASKAQPLEIMEDLQERAERVGDLFAMRPIFFGEA
jgi:hypothetical protein